MKKLIGIISNSLLFLHIFLVVILLFESKLVIPSLLQPIGRMHPLVLHFPIGFIVLLVILNLFKRHIEQNSFEKINQFLVLITALSTVLAAIMGLFLSKEDSVSNLLVLHKWFGVGLSFLVYALTFTFKKPKIFKVVMYAALITVVFAGHYGAGLTHGTDFLTEPLKENKTLEVNEDTPIFAGFVKPIIDAKCVSCHNPNKRKGDLDMSTLNTIELGGEHGALWVAGNPQESAFLKRVHLPIDHEDHMPPEGKKQLTKSEIKLIEAWIEEGAKRDVAFSNLDEENKLGQIISAKLKSKKNKVVYNFDFADKKEIEVLNHPFRTVIQKAPNSPAIDVVINGSETYKPEFLTGLKTVKNQIVSLNLSFLPIDKSAIQFIGTLKNLEELILNFTNLNTEDLQDLKSCSKIKYLSLTGTDVDIGIKSIISQLPSLNKIYLWNTKISEDDIATLKKEFSDINFEIGFVDKEKLQLTPPLLISGATVIGHNNFVEFGHKLKDVEIRYTTDGSEPNKSSKLYEVPFKLAMNAKTRTIKAIAYKNNWLPSDAKSYEFFNKGYKPDKFELVYKGVFSDYVGDGADILLDDRKGSKEVTANKYWATFEKAKPLIGIADFGSIHPKINEIMLSYTMTYWQNVEPIETVNVLVSNDSINWKTYRQIKKGPKVNFSKRKGRSLSIAMGGSNYRFYKIEVKLRNDIRLFTDQLFFY